MTSQWLPSAFRKSVNFFHNVVFLVFLLPLSPRLHYELTWLTSASCMPICPSFKPFCCLLFLPRRHFPSPLHTELILILQVWAQTLSTRKFSWSSPYHRGSCHSSWCQPFALITEPAALYLFSLHFKSTHWDSSLRRITRICLAKLRVLSNLYIFWENKKITT